MFRPLIRYKHIVALDVSFSPENIYVLDTEYLLEGHWYNIHGDYRIAWDKIRIQKTDRDKWKEYKDAT